MFTTFYHIIWLVCTIPLRSHIGTFIYCFSPVLCCKQNQNIFLLSTV